MPDPLFAARTPRLDLPLLFAGQAQKEGTVNEATSRLDALLFLAIEGELAAPPASPEDGMCWLVAAGASGEWGGHVGQIAARQSGNWLFAIPVAGMRLLNKATGQDMRFTTQWNTPARPAAPVGGTTIDGEARTAIAGLVTALVAAGVIPAS